MSWHYLRAAAEESSELPCSGGEQYAPLKSKTTHAWFCSNGKLMDSYLDSLSGTMLQPSTESPGEEKSTLSVEDSLVRTSAQRDRVPDSVEVALAYGRKWPASLAKYDPRSSGWKTRQCSLLGDLEPFSETFPRWGTMRNGELWERTMPAHLTSETESGSWPTPKSSPSGPDFAREGREKSGGDDLATRVAKWATPSARDWKDSPGMSQTGINPDGSERKRTDQLARQVYAGGTPTRQTFPTPTASERSGRNKNTGKGEGLYWVVRDRTEKATTSSTGQTSDDQRAPSGQLNPSWVEWLMGWPIGWTDLKPLETDKFRQWWISHGRSCPIEPEIEYKGWESWVEALEYLSEGENNESK